MLTVPATVRIFLATSPTDMRKSFDGLQGLVQQVFDEELLSGHLFLFINRRRDRIKIMFWDRDGLIIWYKRLEAGTFQLPTMTNDQQTVELEATRLSLLLGGIDMNTARQRKRYRRVG